MTATTDDRGCPHTIGTKREEAMAPRTQREREQPELEESAAELIPVDRLTKRLAVAISRRALLTRTLAAAAATIGVQFLTVLPAAAVNCNYGCRGPCGTCNSYYPSCCSPNGQYCYN